MIYIGLHTFLPQQHIYYTPPRLRERAAPIVANPHSWPTACRWTHRPRRVRRCRPRRSLSDCALKISAAFPP